MHITLLAQQPDLFAEVSQILHREWSEFPNWCDINTIHQRLHARNAAEAKTLTLVATSDLGELMATASIIHYEHQRCARTRILARRSDYRRGTSRQRFGIRAGDQVDR